MDTKSTFSSKAFEVEERIKKVGRRFFAEALLDKEVQKMTLREVDYAIDFIRKAFHAYFAQTTVSDVNASCIETTIPDRSDDVQDN